jgi:hypothetical protein
MFDVSGLPAPLAASLLRCCGAEYGRRFFVAWRPDYPNGVLRHKSLARADDEIMAGVARAGTLHGWQTRTWRAFDGFTPTITDVTAAIPDLWRAILARPRRSWGGETRLVFLPPDALAICDGPVPADAIDITDSVDYRELAGATTPCGLGRGVTSAADLQEAIA